MFTVKYKSKYLFIQNMVATILLGGNLGNRSAYLKFANFHITKDVGEIVRSSKVYETAAWGGLSDKPFLNQVVVVKTEYSPTELMSLLLNIELKAGRTRTVKWGNRTLDLDILFIEDAIINEPSLIVPHPAIQNRRFVLTCLYDLDKNFLHPILNQTIESLLAQCPDSLSTQIYEAKRV